MSYEHLTPAERRRWGMFEVVRAAFKAGMLPVEQEPGKVAIFERPVTNAPEIVIAIWPTPSFVFSLDDYPRAAVVWKEIYEVFAVYMGTEPAAIPYLPPVPRRFYAYATSREELDRFFARRNAEEARKRDPIVRNGKPPLDTWVVGESTALVRRWS